MQAFRSRSTDEVTHIPAVMDTSTGQYIIPWKTIQSTFGSAKFIKNGEAMVPFMKNEKLRRVMPLRIAHHPGVVLEVVERANGPSEASIVSTSLTIDTLISVMSRDRSKSLRPDLSPESSKDVNSTTRATIDTNVNSQLHSRRPIGIGDEPQSPLHTYGQLYSDYFEALMSGKQMQAAEVKQSLDQQFDQLQGEMNKKKALQEQLVKMEQQIQQLLKQTAGSLLEKRKSMDQMRLQTLIRLATVQNQMQPLLLLNFDFHECPTPRLFFVLPKDSPPSNDDQGMPFSKQFRLHYLCECGAHTMPENCQTQHEIHVAKHEGYDIERSKEFFERYGAYLLAMMYMIKYGIVADSMQVPLLENFNVAQELAERHRSTQQGNSIGSLVDDTIDYIQMIQRNSGLDVKSTSDDMQLDEYLVLTNTDLRQLELYLKRKDADRSLGDLYRMVTPEGGVKWVCSDHYRAISPNSTSRELNSMVESSRGKYTKETSTIDISVTSSVQAKRLYDAMAVVHGIQELRIKLLWDATMDDLRALAKAVIKANIVCLVIDGSHLKNPVLDVINRNKRYNPILQLVSSPRLQSLEVKGFENFFLRVSSPTLASTSRIRMFSVDSYVPFDEKTIKSFNGFLDHCSSLTSVELNLHGRYPIAKTVDNIVRRLGNLKTLKTGHRNLSFTSQVVKNKIQDVSMTIRRLNSLSVDDLEFIQQSDLVQLAIECSPEKEDEGRLADILRCCPRLNALRIGCLTSRILAVTNFVPSTRATLLQQGGSSSLQTFELVEEGHSSSGEWGFLGPQSGIFIRLSFIEDSPGFDMVTQIRMQSDISAPDQGAICEYIRQYGWSVVDLQVTRVMSDAVVASLSDSISKKGSQLESLDVYPFELTETGLNHLGNVIEHAPSLTELRLPLTGMKQDDRIASAQVLLRRFGNRLTQLALSGSHSNLWLPPIVQSFPTRECFPKLTSFVLSLRNDSRGVLPPGSLPWIMTMISNATAKEPVSPRTPGPSASSLEWKPLTSIALVGVELVPEEWKMVVEALDLGVLQRVSLRNSNFGEEQLKLLVGRVLDPTTERVSLESFDIRDSKAAKAMDSRGKKAVVEQLQKIPSIEM